MWIQKSGDPHSLISLKPLVPFRQRSSWLINLGSTTDAELQLFPGHGWWVLLGQKSLGAFQFWWRSGHESSASWFCWWFYWAFWCVWLRYTCVHFETHRLLFKKLSDDAGIDDCMSSVNAEPCNWRLEHAKTIICSAFGVVGDQLFRSKSHSALPASPWCQSENHWRYGTVAISPMKNKTGHGKSEKPQDICTCICFKDVTLHIINSLLTFGDARCFVSWTSSGNGSHHHWCNIDPEHHVYPVAQKPVINSFCLPYRLTVKNHVGWL